MEMVHSTEPALSISSPSSSSGREVCLLGFDMSSALLSTHNFPVGWSKDVDSFKTPILLDLSSAEFSMSPEACFKVFEEFEILLAGRRSNNFKDGAHELLMESPNAYSLVHLREGGRVHCVFGKKSLNLLTLLKMRAMGNDKYGNSMRKCASRHDIYTHSPKTGSEVLVGVGDKGSLFLQFVHNLLVFQFSCARNYDGVLADLELPTEVSVHQATCMIPKLLSCVVDVQALQDFLLNNLYHGRILACSYTSDFIDSAISTSKRKRMQYFGVIPEYGRPYKRLCSGYRDSRYRMTDNSVSAEIAAFSFSDLWNRTNRDSEILPYEKEAGNGRGIIKSSHTKEAFCGVDVSCMNLREEQVRSVDSSMVSRISNLDMVRCRKQITGADLHIVKALKRPSTKANGLEVSLGKRQRVGDECQQEVDVLFKFISPDTSQLSAEYENKKSAVDSTLTETDWKSANRDYGTSPEFLNVHDRYEEDNAFHTGLGEFDESFEGFSGLARKCGKSEMVTTRSKKVGKFCPVRCACDSSVLQCSHILEPRRKIDLLNMKTRDVHDKEFLERGNLGYKVRTRATSTAELRSCTTIFARKDAQKDPDYTKFRDKMRGDDTDYKSLEDGETGNPTAGSETQTCTNICDQNNAVQKDPDYVKFLENVSTDGRYYKFTSENHETGERIEINYEKKDCCLTHGQNDCSHPEKLDEGITTKSNINATTQPWKNIFGRFADVQNDPDYVKYLRNVKESGAYYKLSGKNQEQGKPTEIAHETGEWIEINYEKKDCCLTHGQNDCSHPEKLDEGITTKSNINATTQSWKNIFGRFADVQNDTDYVKYLRNVKESGAYYKLSGKNQEQGKPTEIAREKDSLAQPNHVHRAHPEKPKESRETKFGLLREVGRDKAKQRPLRRSSRLTNLACKQFKSDMVKDGHLQTVVLDDEPAKSEKMPDLFEDCESENPVSGTGTHPCTSIPLTCSGFQKDPDYAQLFNYMRTSGAHCKFSNTTNSAVGVCCQLCTDDSNRNNATNIFVTSNGFQKDPDCAQFCMNTRTHGAQYKSFENIENGNPAVGVGPQLVTDVSSRSNAIQKDPDYVKFLDNLRIGGLYYKALPVNHESGETTEINYGKDHEIGNRTSGAETQPCTNISFPRGVQKDPDYVKFLQNLRISGASYKVSLPNHETGKPTEINYEKNHTLRPKSGAIARPAKPKTGVTTESNTTSMSSRCKNIPGRNIDDQKDPDYVKFLQNLKEYGSYFKSCKKDKPTKIKYEKNCSLLPTPVKVAPGKANINYYSARRSSRLIKLENEQCKSKMLEDGNVQVAVLDEQPAESEKIPDSSTYDAHKGVYQTTSFEENLKIVLAKPYDKKEHDELLEEAFMRKPVEGTKNLRFGRTSTYASNRLGLSYTDHYHDFEELLISSRSNNKIQLNLLRGFFFWLQHISHPDSYRPWPSNTGAVRPNASPNYIILDA